MALLYRFPGVIFHISNYKYSVNTLQCLNLYTFKYNSYLVPYMCKSTSQSNVSNSEQKEKNVSNKYANSEFIPFSKMIASRRNEAQRSVLVQVHSEQSCNELQAYCRQFGEVQELRHYALPESLHFILVEFEKAEDVRHLLDSCSHTNTTQIIPVRSPLLWFRAGDKKKLTNQAAGHSSLVEQFGNTAPSQSELRERLQSAESFSAQLSLLHESTRLSELGVRLRFLTARQIELAVGGLFPRSKALPFGSSVNGFGRTGCDLDLVLQLDQDDNKSDSSRLVFHAKTAMSNGRTQVQRHMECIGDICQLFLPGCSHIRRILQARVPIIKYKQELMQVECDLSMTNMCAVHMSELLYLMGAVDERVRPLVFTVRCWAKEAGLTNVTPGRWVTNFTLSLMVLIFLQHEQMLPSLNTLVALAGPEDQFLTSEGANCTFLRDITKLTPTSTPNQTLESLLFRFFEFYSAFDFGTRGLSLADPVPIIKPDHCALYLANPLERGLNVSKNVSSEETERLKMELRNAAWNMESKMDVRTDGKEAWGLVALLEAPRTNTQGRNVFYLPPKSSARMVDVKELFSDEMKDDKPGERAVKRLDVKSRKKSVDTLVHLQKTLEQRSSGKLQRNSNSGRRRR